MFLSLRRKPETIPVKFGQLSEKSGLNYQEFCETVWKLKIFCPIAILRTENSISFEKL